MSVEPDRRRLDRLTRLQVQPAEEAAPPALDASPGAQRSLEAQLRRVRHDERALTKLLRDLPAWQRGPARLALHPVVGATRATTLYRAAFGAEHPTLILPRRATGGDDAAGVDQALRRHGGGEPLPEELQRELGALLGQDLSSVRLYHDRVAAEAAATLGAEAFTIGEDIFFAEGRRDFSTAAGRKLLLHELAHVLQRRQGRLGAPAATRVTDPGEAVEREAEATAERLLNDAALAPASTSSSGTSAASGHVIARQVAAPAAGAGDPFSDRPDRYANLHPDIVALLQRSFLAGLPEDLFPTVDRHQGVAVADLARRTAVRTPTFWDRLDVMETAHLQAIVQVHTRAVGIPGLWSVIEHMKSAYVGTSWGFDFHGNQGVLQSVVQTGNFCSDHPWTSDAYHPSHQVMWREMSGAGGPGLHVGVSRTTALHNIHFDSHNPAVRQEVIGHGCAYDAVALRDHWHDISTDGENGPAPFYEIDSVRFGVAELRYAVDQELGEAEQLSPDDPALLANQRRGLEELDALVRDLLPRVQAQAAQATGPAQMNTDASLRQERQMVTQLMVNQTRLFAGHLMHVSPALYMTFPSDLWGQHRTWAETLRNRASVATIRPDVTEARRIRDSLRGYMAESRPRRPR